MKRWWYALVEISVLALCSGCVAAAVAGAGAGAGAYAYVQGELQATYSVPIEQVWPKTLAAMHELKLTVDRQLIDHLGGEIDARRVDGTVVKVRLKSAGEHSTTVGVRVGTLGNRDHAERIHDIIKKQLGVISKAIPYIPEGVDHA
jgi:hypothetical protein